METTKKLLFPSTEKIAEYKKLADEYAISELEAAILLNRGITDVKSFFNSKLIEDKILDESDKAAEVIVDAIKSGKTICVYSDYDADGWGGAVVGYNMLTELGAKVFVYTNRREMGFGICKEGIDQLLNKHPETNLIVTADNGIVAVDAVAYAISKGLEVVVTDHHEPLADGSLPECSARVNPNKIGETYPCKALCGASVLWKVLSICANTLGQSDLPKKYMDIIALSTIADCVPLVSENRAIVDTGLRMMTDNCRPQWPIMKKILGGGFNPITKVDTRTIGFTFGPAINAVSRLKGNIDIPIHMFTTANEATIKTETEFLKQVNEERKALTKDYTNAAMLDAEAWADLPIIIVKAEEFHEGIVGLIAGRLKEAYNKPTLCFTKDSEGNWKGSGRSIPEFPIKEQLDKAQEQTDSLLAYGGHALACGLTVKGDKMDEFIAAMIEIAMDVIKPEDLIKKVKIDYVAKEEDITNLFIDRLNNLAPFGQDFEEPAIFLTIENPTIKFIGQTSQHISFKGTKTEITSWYGAKKVTSPDKVKKVSAVVRFERDDWGIKAYADPTDLIVEYSD